MEQSHCTFERVEMLPHNVGYVKLNSFPHPAVCAATARAAMASVNGADAVIFDLRDNRGGYPAMVMLLAAYLFDRPQNMYNPRETTAQWTESPVSGSKLADKPVFVLTSRRTFSGAEHFSYDLKMLERATIVGERTGGAADVGAFHRIDDHFGIGIRESPLKNPYAEPDWAVVGVQPHVSVPAGEALATAQKLAETKMRRK
jgi:C-terminal processing protease CtpA/Prc